MCHTLSGLWYSSDLDRHGSYPYEVSGIVEILGEGGEWPGTG